MEKERNIAPQGIVIFSLDFEMMWGVHDSKGSSYYGNITAVHEIIPKLLKLFEKYKIHCTWATIGALFARNKNELMDSLPLKRPNYDNQQLSSYSYLDTIAEESKIHFAPHLIKKILGTPYQELGSHTYMHYYCEELGQNIDEFEADIQSYDTILKKENIAMTSFVFPRNQYSVEYLKVIQNYGFCSFRGLESNWLNRIKSRIVKRYLLFLDSYIKISKDTTYYSHEILGEPLLNIKSSYFYRPYSNNHVLEYLKRNRVKKLIKKAAKKGKIVHIWCHPHNFGGNIEKSLFQFEDLLSYCSELTAKFGMKSLNMGELAGRLYSENCDACR